jgi:hypothetical protein
MKKIKALKFSLRITGLALLAACATPTQTRLSDGTLVYQIDCDPSALGMNYCFDRAGKTCGAAGYTIVDQDGQMISRDDATDMAAEARVKAYVADQNSILVRCGM